MSFSFFNPKKVDALKAAGFTLADGNPDTWVDDPSSWPDDVTGHWVSGWKKGAHVNVVDGPDGWATKGTNQKNKAVKAALRKAGF